MRLRGSFVSAALVLSAVPVIAGPVPFACASEGPDATLVIDTGSSEQFLCVALDSSSVSGIRLIQLASEQHGFSYSLGYQGQAVCMLYGVGSEEEECFEGGQPFWGYWRGNSSGGWTWSGTGAGGTSVEDGDVEGWSYGTGSDGSSHQAPPTTTHEAVCGPEQSEGGDKGGDGGPKPEKPRGGGGDRGDRGGGGNEKARKNDPAPQEPGTGSRPGTEAPATGGTEQADPNGPASDDARKKRSDRKERERRNDRKEKRALEERTSDTASPLAEATPVPSSDPSPEAAPASSRSDEGGPPAAGIVGLLLALGLGAGGAWFLKRKHAPAR